MKVVTDFLVKLNLNKMKGKNSSIPFVYLLIALIAVTSVIALSDTSFSVSISPEIFSKTSSSMNVTITNSEAEILNFSVAIISPIVDYGNHQITVSPASNTFQLNSGNVTSFIVSRGAIPDGFFIGQYSTTMNITAMNITNSSISYTKTYPISFLNSFCDSGDKNDSTLEMDITLNNNGEGEDDSWLPLDEIEVIVKLKNDGEEKLKDVIFELGLIEQTTGKNVAKDLVWISTGDESVEVGNIQDDESETHTFEFKVDPDMGKDETEFLLVVKAYPEGDESDVCIDYSDDFEKRYVEEISIDRESDENRQVVLDELSANPSPAFCGEEITVEGKVYNIGEDDQEKVKTKIYNKELGIDQYVITKNLDTGNSGLVKFIFTIPQNATEKTYTLELINRYDYNDDYLPEEDIAYKEHSDSFSLHLKVEGNCIKPSNRNAAITPALITESADVKAGKEIVIKATVKNTGNVKTDYTIGVDGNELFSTTGNINPGILTLEPNATGESLITLKLDKGATGNYTFNIKTVFDGNQVKQPVSLSIAPKTGLNLSALTENFKENWVIWAVVAVNIILIISIIIIAFKVSRD